VSTINSLVQQLVQLSIYIAIIVLASAAVTCSYWDKIIAFIFWHKYTSINWNMWNNLYWMDLVIQSII